MKPEDYRKKIFLELLNGLRQYYFIEYQRSSEKNREYIGRLIKELDEKENEINCQLIVDN